MEMSGQLHTPDALPSGKEPLVPIGYKVGSGCGGKEKNSQPVPGLELPIIQPVDQPYITALSRLIGLVCDMFYAFNF
jgi:hypothetical protein